MELVPHFAFAGQAEAALNFYVSVFNGKIESLIRYKDFQSGMAQGMNGKDMDKLVYSLISFGRNRIAMCDSCDGEKRNSGGNISMDISYGDPAEIKHIYDALSAGGQILMPLGKTSWSENFASVIDKFGIGWNLMQD